MIPIKKVYVTKEQADALNVKANCILLNAKSRYYYAEEFGKFIEIEEWEYHRILNNPYLYQFSTALKKHFEWCAAISKARTLTFADALGQTQSVSGGPEGESVSPAQPNEPSLETANATRKPIALFLTTFRETIAQFAQRIFKTLTKPGLLMEFRHAGGKRSSYKIETGAQAPVNELAAR